MHDSKWLPVLLFLVLLAQPAFSAGNRDSTELHPVDTVKTTEWGVEIRPGLLQHEEFESEGIECEATATVELRYYTENWLSIDGAYNPYLPAIHFGVSVYPLSFVYLQGAIGQTFVEYFSIFQRRPFDPDFSYTLRGGLRVTIGEWLTVSAGAGILTMVDTDYCPDCMPGEPVETTVSPVYTATDSYVLWEIGIGLTW